MGALLSTSLLTLGACEATDLERPIDADDSDARVLGDAPTLGVRIDVIGPPELVWNYDVNRERCAIPDAPIRMWRDWAQRTHAMIAGGETFRLTSTSYSDFVVDVNQAPEQLRTNTLSIYEQDYDNRTWPMSVWTEDGINLSVLAHHEWYPEWSRPPDDCIGYPAQWWFNSIHHLSSSDGGRNLSLTHPVNGQQSETRVAIAPEKLLDRNRPFGGSDDVRFGYFHPSNLVREGAYHYVTVGISEIQPGVPYREGFGLFRTSDIDAGGWASGAWQYYNGSGWTTITSRLSAGTVHVFTHVPMGSNSTTIGFASGVAQANVFPLSFGMVRSEQAGRWILHGYTASTEHAAFTTTPTLANPQFSPVSNIGGSAGLNFGGGLHPSPATTGAGQQVSSWHASYPSITDPGSPGFNFMYADGTAYLYYVAATPGIIDRDIYRVPIRIEPVTEGGCSGGGNTCVLSNVTDFDGFCWPYGGFHGDAMGFTGCTCFNSPSCGPGTAECACTGIKGVTACDGSCTLPESPYRFGDVCWPNYSFTGAVGFVGCSCSAGSCSPGTGLCQCAGLAN
ncbi:MAG: DUF1804 family protein [Deltaproteobacteria bacterium]|nr:DUF1804 family protein [Deltaproteobacteria bacterium]